MKKLFYLSALTLIYSTACSTNKNKPIATGTFEATEIVLSAENSGTIKQLFTDEGSVVQANDILLVIDTMQLHLKKKQLNASIKALEQRQPSVSIQIAAYNQQISNLLSDKKRIEQLVLDKAMPQKSLDDLIAQIQVIEKQKEALSESLGNSNSGLENEINALFAQLDQLNDQLNRCIVRAPINGTILMKYGEIGELAIPGKALLKIADMQTIYLRAYIQAEQLAELKIGDSLNVSDGMNTATPRTYRGIVSWISNDAEFTPKNILTHNERSNLVYAVKIAIKNDGYLKIGMYGECYK